MNSFEKACNYLEAASRWFQCKPLAHDEALMHEVEEKLDIDDPLVADFRTTILATAYGDEKKAIKMLKHKKEFKV